MTDEQKKDIADIVKANADISLNNIERKINEQINAEKKALRRCNQMLEKYRKQEDKSPRKAKVQGKLKSMLDNMDKDKLAKTREELANSSESCKDLEEAGKEWLRPQLDKSYEKYGENKMMELTRFDGYAMLEAIEFGANWHKHHMEVNRIKHCNSISKEQAQMMAKAVDGDITFDYYGDGDKTYGCIAHDSFCLEDFGLKDRDKVKVIVIKED